MLPVFLLVNSAERTTELAKKIMTMQENSTSFLDLYLHEMFTIVKVMDKYMP